MSLRVRDKVTIVISSRFTAVYHKYVTRLYPDGVFGIDWTMTDGSASGMKERLADEGISWIRGHHEIDSDDARACIAAAKLVPERDAVPHHRES